MPAPKPVLLTWRQAAPSLSARLEAEFDLAKVWEMPDPDAWIAAHGATVRGLINIPSAPVDEALLARLPKLEIVANYGVGYEDVDVAACARRGVVVTHARGVLDDDVADAALALMLMATRGFGAAERYVRAGKWEAEGGFPLSSLTLGGRTCGILGLGRIGTKVATRALACGMRVAYHGRNRQPDKPYAYHPSPRSLAEASDVLINVMPGGPQTQGLIDAEVLAALGPSGVFVNVGRGASVDEPALIAALASGTIAAAGLDVFADEPRVPKALMEMENVVLLPHVGSATAPTREAMGTLMADNLTSWFATGRALTPVPETPQPGTP